MTSSHVFKNHLYFPLEYFGVICFSYWFAATAIYWEIGDMSCWCTSGDPRFLAVRDQSSTCTGWWSGVVGRQYAEGGHRAATLWGLSCPARPSREASSIEVSVSGPVSLTGEVAVSCVGCCPRQLGGGHRVCWGLCTLSPVMVFVTKSTLLDNVKYCIYD